MWHTWFDRDLTFAGRVLVSLDEKPEYKLVHINKPILCIPNLAIHLTKEKGSFSPNKETHLVPIVATQFKEKLDRSLDSKKIVKSEDKTASFSLKHHSVLFDLISKELNCNKENIQGF